MKIRLKKKEPISNENLKKWISPHKFIEDNSNIWCFDELIKKENVHKGGNIRFYLKFSSGGGYSTGGYFKKRFYLCEDGFVKASEKDKTIDIYYNYNRNEIKKICEKCNLIIKEKCMQAGFDVRDYENYFSIEFEKCGKPEHLFTKEEMKKLMWNADDRVNNRLVIDENGYAQLLQNISEGTLYPVRNESWQSGNMYVGKYSNLSDLDRTYICSLQGWLIYLEVGKTVYMDYMHDNNDIEELLQEIKKYY